MSTLALVLMADKVVVGRSIHRLAHSLSLHLFVQGDLV